MFEEKIGKWSDKLRKDAEDFLSDVHEKEGDYPGIEKVLAEIIGLALEEGFEEGEQHAKENVGDWIDLSEFAPDHSWRD